MTKKVVRVKTKTKVVENKQSRTGKPTLSSNNGGIFTKKIALNVKKNK